jgi:hypothetical protein
VKSNFNNLIVPILMVALVASCTRSKPSGSATIPYVENILADTTSAEYSLISSFDESDNQGCIAIIGTPEECFSISEELMSSDIFDNIDGRKAPDGLPDFAGETILSIIDEANSPYEGYLKAKNSEYLRELTVREVLASLDSKCDLSPFDQKHATKKPVAKIIILASPIMADYGFFDVDTIFRHADKDIPMISMKDTSESVSSKCYNVLRKKDAFTHNISFPKAEGLITVPSSIVPSSALVNSLTFTDNYKYSRTPNSDKKTFSVIKYSDRYLSEELLTLLSAMAPKTYQSYVQDKYQ